MSLAEGQPGPHPRPGLTCTGSAWGPAAGPCYCGSAGRRSPGGTGVAAWGTALSCSCPARSWCLQDMGPHGDVRTPAHSGHAATGVSGQMTRNAKRPVPRRRERSDARTHRPCGRALGGPDPRGQRERRTRRHGLILLKGSVQDRQTRGRVWPGLLWGDRTVSEPEEREGCATLNRPGTSKMRS